MNCSRFLLILLAALPLAGCAAAILPSAQEQAAANYGIYPSNYQEIVEKHLHDTLKDPYSVRDLVVEAPVKDVLQSPPLLGGGRTYGYIIRFSYNAKNSYGAYVGVQTDFFFIRDGKIIPTGTLA